MGNVQVIYLKGDHLLGLKTPFNYKDRCRKLEFRKWDGTNRAWTIPATLEAMTGLVDEFGLDDLEMDAEVREMYDSWTHRTKAFLAVRGRMDLTLEDADYRYRTKLLPPRTGHEDDCECGCRSPLPHPYQIAGTLAAISRNNVLELDEMGLGKSKMSIDAAVARFDRGEIQRAVVIVPSSLKYTWGGHQKQRLEGQIQVWAPPELGNYDNVLVVDGTATKRAEKLAYGQAYQWIVINYELVDKHIDILQDIARDQLVIIDEVHRIKNRKAKSTKAVMKLEPKYIIAMTGTAVANKPEDVWALGDLVEPGIFGSYWNFLDMYTERGGFQGKEVLSYVNLDDLHRRLDAISIRRTKKQCLPQLPPKVYETRHVEMADDQAREYKRMQDEAVALYSQMPETEFQLQAFAALAQLLRLQQIADGFISAEGRDPEWFKHQPKLSALDEIVEDVTGNGEKLVIWTRFLPSAHAIQERYAAHGAVCYTGETSAKDRPGIVDRFMNDPSCRVFVGQIHTGGLGLTLTSAQTQVFYDLWWSPSVVAQAEDRLHRIGTRGTVTVIRLLCRESIDENVERMLRAKSQWAKMITGDTGETLTQQAFLNLLLGDATTAAA